MEDFNIYFSDLKEESQRRLMEAVGITDPHEMNWDFDLLPLATYPIPINDEEQKNTMDEMRDKMQSLFLPQMSRWKKNALCLPADEFSAICVKIYGVFVNVHYQMDGLWIDIGDQTIEDESLCKELSNYLRRKVLSVHIDDDENVHVWIIYEGEKNGQNL